MDLDVQVFIFSPKSLKIFFFASSQRERVLVMKNKHPCLKRVNSHVRFTIVAFKPIQTMIMIHTQICRLTYNTFDLIVFCYSVQNARICMVEVCYLWLVKPLDVTKTWIHTWSGKAYEVTVVNQALSSLHGGSRTRLGVLES